VWFVPNVIIPFTVSSYTDGVLKIILYNIEFYIKFNDDKFTVQKTLYKTNQNILNYHVN